ncbi:MAG: sigma-54-dependent Fis family transcriptional regulator [Alphaproteobacteria bacterium]|nr:sigma-54-dependent Fis family transcriptional regulator [Alphaproteobacteria bacterium]
MHDPGHDRNLHLALLRAIDDPRAMVEVALEIAVDVAGAERGWIGLFDADADPTARPRWWTSRAFDQDALGRVQVALSTGILAEALRTGETQRTASAHQDPRFAGRDSVRAARIEAVLCVPLPGLVRGAIYLQGRRGGGPFSDAAVTALEAFAVSVDAVASRLLATAARGPRPADPTAPWRARLRADGVIGRSQALADVFEELEWMARSPLDVLLLGPSGSGKSLLAGVLHRTARPAGPFVTLNCAAIPEHLFESELFGAVRGAYTDAVDHDGYVAAAEGGTLFLDEIGELPLPQQAKLLTFLQTRSWAPVGAPGRTRTTSASIVLATNVDLLEAVSMGRFREDLYWRLEAAVVRLPALADRREDILPIARSVMAGVRADLRLTPVAELELESRSWPGDVRQLTNTMLRAAYRAAARDKPLIAAEDLAGTREPERASTLKEATDTFLRSFLRSRLETNAWNVSATARELDVSRAHLNKLIATLGLRRP